MTFFEPPTQWHVVSPGEIWLPTTELTIRLRDNWENAHRYQILWQGKTVGESMTLDYAKLVARDWLRELLSMGIEP